jgi:maltodextrin utilization protein YvdJ
MISEVFTRDEGASRSSLQGIRALKTDAGATVNLYSVPNLEEILLSFFTNNQSIILLISCPFRFTCCISTRTHDVPKYLSFQT